MSVAFAVPAAIAALMLCAYALSLVKRDASVVDCFWGGGFVLVAWVAWGSAGASSRPQELLLPLLVTLWGLRLSAYLTWRNWGEAEDPRYVAMRERHAPFALKSLWIVFGLQGLVMGIVALPVVLASGEPRWALGALDWFGAGVVLVGVAWESLADLQLARFKADPGNAGAVFDRGLWRLTRHPNYFGDAVVWWGLHLVALARGAPSWTAVGPLLMTFFLLKVSGVPLLEARLRTTRPGYADYVARTPAFLPWAPGSPLPARWLRQAACALAAGGLLFLCGPRPRAAVPPLAASPLPEDLLADIAAREERGDVRAGCEASISWVDSSTRARTPLAIVYLHGFSATRQETAPYCERLAARLGANRFEARLTGHGRTGEALGSATAADWMRDAREALAVGRRLGERVLLVGCSTGGTLAAWLLSEDRGADLAGVILISPNLGPRHPLAQLLTGPWGRALTRVVVGAERGWQPQNEAHARYWTTRYPSPVLVEMQALVDLVRGLDLRSVQSPLLVVASRDDAVVSAAATEAWLEDVGSPLKSLLWFENSQDPSSHVLAGDVLSPKSTDALVRLSFEFVRRLR